MTIRCPECGKPIEADPATIRTLHCRHCGYRDKVETEPTPKRYMMMPPSDGPGSDNDNDNH
jgi:DNA-directed RNA polymerase subunit RPC12/RpoP